MIVGNNIYLHLMAILASHTFCILHYDATILFSLILGKLWYYTDAIAIGQSDGLLELHIFRNQVYLIAEAILAIPPAPGMVKISRANKD